MSNEFIDKLGDPEGAEKLKTEILNMILRYGDEANITMCEAIGTIELVKATLLERCKTKD